MVPRQEGFQERKETKMYKDEKAKEVGSITVDPREVSDECQRGKLHVRRCNVAGSSIVT